MSEVIVRERPAVAPAVPVAPSPPRDRWWVPVAIFLVVGVVLWLVAGLSAQHLPWASLYPEPPSLPGGAWFEAWNRWDAKWYAGIALDGYGYQPGAQSSVAFFPAYPMVIWAFDLVLPNVYIAATVATAVAGLAIAVLFYRWARTWLSPQAAATGLVVLVLYPYSWYLFGAVYADALCLAAMLAAALALERDKVWLAGLFGLVASGTRLVGLVFAVALVLRLIERRGGFARLRWRRRDLAVLGAFGGFAGFCAYLWVRWGDPLLFSEVQSAPGWDQGMGVRTFFKVSLYEQIVRLPTSLATWNRVFQALLALGVLLLIPRIVRRFGLAYAAFTLGVVLLPVVGSKDFMGTGRYLLAAFPAVAILGELLAERPRLRRVVLIPSALALLALTSLFARGYYLS